MRYLVVGRTLCAVFVAIGIGSVAGAAEQTSVPDAAKIDFRWGVQIPLRDGINLNATVYTPRGQREPAPCVFTLTPYESQNYHARGIYFAAHGYPYLTVDTRGRGDSPGEFQPFIQEAKDGYDVVEWLARQPYCNGKVTMWGGSYAGYNQWAAAKESPPHLATIQPAAAPYMGLDFPLRTGMAFPGLLQWVTLVTGRTAQDQIVWKDMAFLTEMARRWFVSGRPFKESDEIFGNPSPIFQEWLAHPHPDEYWDRFNPTTAEYAKIEIPILSITGAYDGSQLGTLTHYREHMKAASPQARDRHYLILGPWEHSGTRTPLPEFGGLKFGPAALVDLPKLHREWFAWTMQDGPKPGFLQKRVAYYVIGAEKWRYADTLEAVTARSQAYFLDSTGNPTDVLQSASLSAQAPGQSKPDRYIYDPRDIGWADAESKLDPESLVTQAPVYAQSGKQLIYHSAPFDKDTEVSGFFKLSAWLSIDRPDTDFNVSIYEINAAGESVLLTSDMMRARYRESLREPKLISTQEPLRYDFERFNFVSRLVKRGSRLRLVVGPINSINSEKNYNSGGVVAAESMKDAKAVTVNLYHDRARPSALYVPLGQPEVAGEPSAPPSSFTSSR